LGDQLALIPTYPAQKRYLEKFLLTHFGGKAFIWLRNPPKPLLSKIAKNAFPFNPDSILQNNKVNRYRHEVIKTNNDYWIIMPLLRGETDVGNIILQHSYPLDPQALESLEKISKITGLVIYATLQKHLQDWRQKHLSLVRTVTAQVSQITDLALLTRQITKLIQKSFNYYYVAVFLINNDTNRLQFKASAGSDQSERPEFEHDSHPGFTLGEHMIGFVAETGRELIANDVMNETRYQEVDSLAKTKSECVLPLSVEARIFGVLDVQSDKRNAFADDDLLVLRALADNFAIAIESAQLYKGVQTRAQQLATVSEVSRAITYILDIDELLQKIVSLIHDRFSFPYVHLYIVDPVQKKISFKAGSGTRSELFLKEGVSFDLNANTGILPKVAQTHETKRINDVNQDPLFFETPYIQETTGSEMALPLSFGGEILGVLDILSDQKNAFSLEDQQLMETLADNLAIAIRNARLYRSEKWRRQVAESLRDVAGLLSENTALDDVLGVILKQLHKNLPCDIAGIWLFDHNATEEKSLEEQELFLTAYQVSEHYPSEALDHLSFISDAWVRHALQQKQPTIRQSDETIGPIAKQYNMAPDYSAIAAPLYTGEETLGMLTLTHHTHNRYGLETQKITSAFASYAAIAIKNTRLYAMSQEQAWISTILLQVAQATQSLSNLDELVATIVRLTPMVAGVKGCGLFLREPDSEVFSLYALYGIGDSGEELQMDHPITMINAPILNELVNSQVPIHVKNPGEGFNLPDRITRQMSKDNLILLPLITRNEVVGGFLLSDETRFESQSDSNKVISEERYKIIQGIIQQTAIAIENIRLLEGKQEEAYVSTVLLQVAQAVVSSSNLQDTLDSIVHIMPILVGIDSSVIYLWNPTDNCFQTTHATTKNSTDEEGLLKTTFAPEKFPMLDVVFRNNRPIVYPFVENILPPEDWDLVLPDEGQIDPTPVLQSHYALLMGFPLSVKDEVYGVLLAQDKNVSTNRERRFELIWGIAQQASLAIQNDRLNKEMLDRQRLEREFQLAREIQQTFLPDEVPEMPGWEMDVRWETARQVGGDFYDYFLLPDGRLAFIIADVSDKGLAASLYMTVTRTLLRAAAMESNSPATTLEHVNDLLLSNSQNGLFVTTFYGVLCLDDGNLTYTIAGHNPPLLIRYQTNQVITFDKGGIALGALPDINLEQRQVRLNPGDCLVLFTDGVTEAFNIRDQMYGDDRLKGILETTIGQNASHVLETLETDLEAFREDAPLSDDTTMLAIYRCRSLADNDRDVCLT
jgi:phosphoserine phosphatase RsbU/P